MSTPDYHVTRYTRLHSDQRDAPLIDSERLIQLVNPDRSTLTVHQHNLWQKHSPILPRPNSTCYLPRSIPPPSPLPRTSVHPSNRQTQVEALTGPLPEFQHWKRTPSPSTSTSPLEQPQPRREPSSKKRRPPDDESSVKSRRREQQEMSGSSNSRRTSKRLLSKEMDSPLKEVEEEEDGRGMSSTTLRRSNRKSATTATKSDGTNQKKKEKSSKAIVLVPPTPSLTEPVNVASQGVNDDGEKSKKRKREKRKEEINGIEMVKLWIPAPYRHTSTPLNRFDPSRREATSTIHYSFVDPNFSPVAPPTKPSTSLNPSSSTTTRSRSNRSASNNSSNLTATSSSMKFNLDVISPKTAEFLRPGRMGSWIIPVEGRFEFVTGGTEGGGGGGGMQQDRENRGNRLSGSNWNWKDNDHTSSIELPIEKKPRSTITKPLNPTTSTFLPKDNDPRSVDVPDIEWTRTRLTTFWSLLSDLNESGAHGSLRAAFHFLPSPPITTTSSSHPFSATSTTTSGNGSNSRFLPTCFLKITINADLALKFRRMLDLVSCKSLQHMVKVKEKEKDDRESELAGRKGGGREGEEDGVKRKEKKKEVEKKSKGGGGRDDRRRIERDEDGDDDKDADGKVEEEELNDETKWLKGRRLLWIDEMGRTILIA